MNNKTILGGLVAGVAFFFLGWVVYGMLLKDFMADSSNMEQTGMRKMEEMVWWAMVASCLIKGYFVALMLGWSSTRGMSIGLQKGALIGLLLALAHGLGMHAMTTCYKNMNALIVDVAASTVIFAIAGGIVGWIMGMDKKTA